MAEEHKPQPKVQGERKPRLRRFQPKKVGFKAPMLGIEDAIFDFGQLKHAAQFQKTCEALPGHTAIMFKRGGAMMAKAILELQAPVITIPADPAIGATYIIFFKWKRTYEAKERELNNWTEANKRCTACSSNTQLPR